MQRQIRVAALLGLAFMLAGARPALYADTKSPVEAIRKELMQLPYYSVFDYLAFSYDQGTVTLMGLVPAMLTVTLAALAPALRRWMLSFTMPALDRSNQLK